MIPYGRNLNFFLQKHFGQIREINIEDKIRQMQEFSDPILQRFGSLSGLRITEIGTGWAPVLPIALSLTGARCRTFDVVRHLRKDILANVLTGIAGHLDFLSRIGGCSLESVSQRYRKLSQEGEVGDILKTIHVHYTAPVDTRFLPIEDGSEDVLVSRLVLQHIPPKNLPDVVRETYRILKPGGIAIHSINLHDEYAMAHVDQDITLVNFLKYPSWFWEHFGNNSVKYVNRSRYPYYLEVVETAGFRILGL